MLYPNERMLIAPSLVLYLLGSVLLGPGLTSNVLFKENWGRPRPISLQQFAGTAPFQPWLIGAALGATSRALAGAGLRSTGQHLHKRVACL